MAYIKVSNLTKEYRMGEITIKAVDNVSFDIEEGELVVVLGPSGAGKTTILNILGGMDSPSNGSVVVADKDISKYTEKELTKYRRNDIWFVFSIL